MKTDSVNLHSTLSPTALKEAKGKLETALSKFSVSKKGLWLTGFTAMVLAIISVAAAIFLWEVLPLFALGMSAAALAGAVIVPIVNVRAHQKIKKEVDQLKQLIEGS